MNREELEDLISDAVSDSLDLDWTARDAAKAVIAVLESEGLRVVGSDSDLAIAIGEHAFKAGYEIGQQDGDDKRYDAVKRWSEYTPPEDLCGKAF